MDTAETTAFIESSRPALDHLFNALDEYNGVLSSAQKEVEAIENSQKALSDLFMYRDQWSPNANHHYAEYVHRMEQLASSQEAAKDEAAERLESGLAKIGATVESMSSLAGAVLQIAKQVLSLRHSGKPSLTGEKSIGSQNVSEVIWEGRNHAMHWDEGAPRTGVQTMLGKLSADLGVTIHVGSNNSLSILGALGWSSTDDVVRDLEALV